MKLIALLIGVAALAASSSANDDYMSGSVRKTYCS